MGDGWVAVAGDPAALAPAVAKLARTGLNDISAGPRLRLFVSPGLPLLKLPDGAGIILGSLFERQGGRIGSIDAALAEALRQSAGQVLIDLYWGSYILFLTDATGWPTILRDPSGAKPLYRARAGEADIIASDMVLLEKAGARLDRIDEEFVRQWLGFPFLQSARTGLVGVEEMLPGVRHSLVDGQWRRETAWSPWRHTPPREELESFEEAAVALRATLLSTIGLVASEAGRIVLELSGGLDSSIVAMALAEAGAEFEAVTFATRARDGDERRYARAVAEAAGVRLTELVEPPLGEDRLPLPKRALRPGLTPVLDPMHRLLADHARAAAADAILTGAGGDNVFCFLTTAAPAVDSARDQGLRAGARTLRDVSELFGCTFRTAARFALRKALAKPAAWPRNLDFLAPGAAADRHDAHPWLDAPPGAPVGKREHVRALLHIRHFLAARDQAAATPLVHPLLAQPIVELCLGIPTWMWVRGGRNRAVARAAFADLLPALVSARRSKGRLESMFVKAFMARRDELRGLLLEGELRKGGLIDAQAVAAYLARDPEPRDSRYFRILDLAAMELWLRSWRG